MHLKLGTILSHSGKGKVFTQRRLQKMEAKTSQGKSKSGKCHPASWKQTGKYKHHWGLLLCLSETEKYPVICTSSLHLAHKTPQNSSIFTCLPKFTWRWNPRGPPGSTTLPSTSWKTASFEMLSQHGESFLEVLSWSLPHSHFPNCTHQSSKSILLIWHST